MATISLKGTGRVGALAAHISQTVQNSGLSCELVEHIQRSFGEVCHELLVFEKYFYRASNRVSLTVSVTGCGEEVYVDAVGSGGGQGPLFKMSWWAEDDFAEVVKQALADKGFEVIHSDSNTDRPAYTEPPTMDSFRRKL